MTNHLFLYSTLMYYSEYSVSVPTFPAVIGALLVMEPNQEIMTEDGTATTTDLENNNAYNSGNIEHPRVLKHHQHAGKMGVTGCKKVKQIIDSLVSMLF